MFSFIMIHEHIILNKTIQKALFCLKFKNTLAQQNYFN